VAYVSKSKTLHGEREGERVGATSCKMTSGQVTVFAVDLVDLVRRSHAAENIGATKTMVLQKFL